MRYAPENRVHAAHFLAEVFAGPAFYRTAEGSHLKMIQHHIGKHLLEAHRKRGSSFWWRNLMAAACLTIRNSVSRFMAYAEWGTKLALINSNLKEMALRQDEPLPKLSWGVPGGP